MPSRFSPLRHPSVFALLSGVLLVLAFPAPHLSLLAWVALAPLLVVLVQKRARWRLFLYGFLAGVVFFAGTCYWIYEVMRIHGHLGPVACVAVVGLFVLVTAPFFGVFSWTVGELARRWQVGALLLAPVVWVTLEWIRTYFPFGGFPWNLLGYTITPHIGWAQPAAYVGVYGLSFMIVAVNAFVSVCWLAPSRRTAVLLVAVAVALGIAWQAGRGIPAEPTTARALLVQTNLPQQDVFDPLWVYNHPDEMEALEQLTRDAVAVQPTPPALVIWPEIPISIYFNQDPVIRGRLIALAQSTRVYFITGTVDYAPVEGSGPDVYNSAVLLSPGGALVAQYEKIELVPFGEYLPAIGRLGFFKRMVREVSDFKPGREYDVMPTDHGRLSMFICYEAIFPGLVRQFVAREGGAEVLVNISNDGWFGRSAAAAQHFNMARLRAVETRRFLLRSTNTGITAVIDPYGRIVSRAPDHARLALPVGFAPRQERSFYARHGDWLPFVCTLAVVAALGRKFWAEALEEAVRQ
ncbi:MAG: apolipoprotein N-acyltransferase [Acidobacteria bacterium]|nr:apolipoprotein N-acyltransferase [Acidobacteriota bacterium]